MVMIISIFTPMLSLVVVFLKIHLSHLPGVFIFMEENEHVGRNMSITKI